MVLTRLHFVSDKREPGICPQQRIYLAEIASFRAPFPVQKNGTLMSLLSVFVRFAPLIREFTGHAQSLPSAH